jgi:uncharacterized protein (DUF58 family)
MSFIEPRLLTALSGLKIKTHMPLPGRFKGELRSTKKGSAIEFADFRDYVPGDDLRSIDWNIYARLNRPYIKLFEETEDIAVRILVDCSRSMDWGDPNKFAYAKALAGCLAYVALNNLNWVSVYGFSSKINARLLPHRGSAHIAPALSFVENLTADGMTSLSTVSKRIRAERSSSGQVIIISDLFDNTLEHALGLLAGRRREVIAIHLLCPQELNPEVLGDVRLVDSETGKTREVSITPRLLRTYSDNLTAWKDGIRRSCTKRGINYTAVDTATPLDEFVLKTMRKRGLLT